MLILSPISRIYFILSHPKNLDGQEGIRARLFKLNCTNYPYDPEYATIVLKERCKKNSYKSIGFINAARRRFLDIYKDWFDSLGIKEYK